MSDMVCHFVQEAGMVITFLVAVVADVADVSLVAVVADVADVSLVADGEDVTDCVADAAVGATEGIVGWGIGLTDMTNFLSILVGSQIGKESLQLAFEGCDMRFQRVAFVTHFEEFLACPGYEDAAGSRPFQCGPVEDLLASRAQ
jgi:hypothetical protein